MSQKQPKSDKCRECAGTTVGANCQGGRHEQCGYAFCKCGCHD